MTQLDRALNNNDILTVLLMNDFLRKKLDNL